MREAYLPPDDGGSWDRVAPAAAGFDPLRLAEAVAFAEANETKWLRDVRTQLETGTFEPPPDNFLFGPVASRSGPNGLILRGGRIVASWGDTRAVDMTFSVAKSYLSILAGLAVADGLIRDLDEPVSRTVDDGGFDGPHNGTITWRHLLHQTSEWEGTLFGKADQVDRNRTLATEFAGAPNMRKGDARPLREPGTFWEYNDVRVNRLSLALLRRFGRALPEVFAERVMGPIGASGDWRWMGYSNWYVVAGGRNLRSVSGGGHWGGGVFIHAEDQARIGLMMARGGAWGGRRILSEDWIRQSLVPCPIKPDYGFLWWLNTGRGPKPSAPADSYWATGAGGNFTWVDPTNDIVAVLRWHDPAQLDAWIARVLGALTGVSRVALVTGGGRGIGRAVAARLLADGWRVVVADRDADGPPGARSVRCDVADEVAVTALVAGVAAGEGRLDGLVCNAGFGITRPLAQLSLADWSAVLGTNLTSIFLLARAAEAMLRAARGGIVTIASTRAHQSEPNTEAYAASKGGVVALTHALAASLAPEVRVNCVSPGWILTKGPAPSIEDNAQHWAGRVGQPEDIAAAVAFLLGDGAGFITGSELVVDGGMTRKMIYV